MIKSKNKTQSLYILGEMLGKTTVFLLKCAMGTYVLGLGCELVWDAVERRAYNVRNKTKQ
ncbi:MAG: hypothetical protein J6I84_04045 [Bacilli bacterium]|nr:hypothetical protein [Bacilli bacterium]